MATHIVYQARVVLHEDGVRYHEEQCEKTAGIVDGYTTVTLHLKGAVTYQRVCAVVRPLHGNTYFALDIVPIEAGTYRNV